MDDGYCEKKPIGLNSQYYPFYMCKIDAYPYKMLT